MLGAWAAHKTQFLIINQRPPSRRSVFTKYYLLILARRDNGEIQQEERQRRLNHLDVLAYWWEGDDLFSATSPKLEKRKIRREEET